MFGVAANIRGLLANTMKSWQIVLTSNGMNLGEVNIKRGIFQADSLSPLLFVLVLIPLTLILRKEAAGYHFTDKTKVNHLLFMNDLKLDGKDKAQLESLTQTVRIFSHDIGMHFGIEKCAVLVLKRGKLVESDGIQLPDDNEIKAPKECEGYKYLGVFEADEMLHSQMKEKVSKEYLKRVRKLGKSKLNGRNLIQGINTWAVSLIRYAGGIINWTKKELRDLDTRTRKTLTMNRALNSRDCVARLYVPRAEGVRDLISVDKCIGQAKNSLQNYILHSDEKRIQAATKGELVTHDLETPKDFKQRRKAESKAEWEEKVLYGQFLRQTDSERNEKTWAWLQRGHLKRETEAVITADQDQAIRTNYIKANIDKTQENDLCRLCRQAKETVSHIVRRCSKLAQQEYKRRHDNDARVVHWDLLGKCGFSRVDKWFEHQPETVLENNDYKLLWYYNIQTDHQISARRPDLVVTNKQQQTCQIIHIAVPEDTAAKAKEEEKLEK